MSKPSKKPVDDNDYMTDLFNPKPVKAETHKVKHARTKAGHLNTMETYVLSKGVNVIFTGLEAGDAVNQKNADGRINEMYYDGWDVLGGKPRFGRPALDLSPVDGSQQYMLLSTVKGPPRPNEAAFKVLLREGRLTVTAQQNLTMEANRVEGLRQFIEDRVTEYLGLTEMPPDFDVVDFPRVDE